MVRSMMLRVWSTMKFYAFGCVCICEAVAQHAGGACLPRDKMNVG